MWLGLGWRRTGRPEAAQALSSDGSHAFPSGLTVDGLVAAMAGGPAPAGPDAAAIDAALDAIEARTAEARTPQWPDRTPERGCSEGAERTPIPALARPARTPPPPPARPPAPPPEQLWRDPWGRPAPHAHTPRRFGRLPYLTQEVVRAWQDEDSDTLPGIHPIEVHALRLKCWLEAREHNPDLSAAPSWTPARVDIDRPAISSRSAAAERGRGLFAYEAEEQYLLMCADHQVWWRPHRWEGTGGVAQHFRALIGLPEAENESPYHYTQIDGMEKRLAFYPIPLRPSERTPAGTAKAAKRTPKRSSAKPARASKPRLRVVKGGIAKVRRAA